MGDGATNPPAATAADSPTVAPTTLFLVEETIHALRSPIDSIASATDALHETDLSSDQRRQVETIDAAVASLTTSFNDLIDLTRIESGGLVLDATPFELSHTLRDVLQSLAPRAQAKGVEVLCRVDPGTPEGVVGDPGRLRQILQRFVARAIDVSRSGAVSLTVGARPLGPHELTLSLTIATAASTSRLASGVLAEDAPPAEPSGAARLEMLIASRLVRIMGGRVERAGDVAGEDAWRFTLRLGARGEPARLPGGASLEDLHGLRVLVLDERDAVGRLHHQTLSGWGFQPEVVGDSEETFRRLRGAAAAGDPFGLLLLAGAAQGEEGFEIARRVKQDPETATTPIILLAAAGQRGDAARCRALGIEAYLSKPLLAVDLLQAIRSILNTADDARDDALLVTKHSLAESRRRLRLLVVEDNAVNRVVAARLLEKRGHSVAQAEHGRQAVEAIDRERFDAVVMDIQMPEMDGFEATALVRRRESVEGGHLPIIALTAHALKGDEERCRAAGMDAYLTKPVNAQALYEAVEHLAYGSRATPAESPSPPQALGPAVDPSELFDQVGGDTELLAEIYRMFQEDAPSMLVDLRGEFARGDGSGIARAAHRLKGTFGALAATAALRAAARVEAAGREGDMASASEALAALENEFARVGPALAAAVSSLGVPAPPVATSS